MLFKDLLKNRRLEIGATMEDIGKRVGVSKATVQRWESGEIANVRRDKIVKLAQALHTTPAYLMGWDEINSDSSSSVNSPKTGIKIPVLGNIAAGIPVEAIQNIVDWEEITLEMSFGGDFFGLVIKGTSMEPKFSEGDVVIVRKQSDCETGQVAVIIVNGCDATVKRIKKRPEGIMLIPTNPEFEPMFYSSAEMESLPVCILGRVVELRAKF